MVMRRGGEGNCGADFGHLPGFGHLPDPTVHKLCKPKSNQNFLFSHLVP